MKSLALTWQFWAVGSAVFAALTAIFAKVGIEGVGSDFATFIRTIVILAALAAILTMTAGWQDPATVSGKSWLFLVLSGIATGLSWLCYYRALQLGPIGKVAPIDKLSVAFAILFGVLFVGESLSWPVAIGGALIVAGSIVIVAF